MRTLIAALALLLTTATVDAKPRHRAHRIHDTAWMRDCIHERTGPDGGIPVSEARTICTAEQPEDEVAAATAQLRLARINAKLAKAKARAAKAIAACELAVSVACEDTTERATDGGECSDATLRSAGSFGLCH